MMDLVSNHERLGGETLLGLHRRFMGWAYDLEAPLQVHATQGIFDLHVTCKSRQHATQVYLRKRPMLRLGLSYEIMWATKNSGKRTRLKDDVLKEHAAMVALMCNAVSSLAPMPYKHPITRLGPANVVRVLAPGGAPIDLWIDNEGRLLTALIDLGFRRVVFRPCSHFVFDDGKKMHSRWLRDDETPVVLTMLDYERNRYTAS